MWNEGKVRSFRGWGELIFREIGSGKYVQQICFLLVARRVLLDFHGKEEQPNHEVGMGNQRGEMQWAGSKPKTFQNNSPTPPPSFHFPPFTFLRFHRRLKTFQASNPGITPWNIMFPLHAFIIPFFFSPVLLPTKVKSKSWETKRKAEKKESNEWRNADQQNF